MALLQLCIWQCLSPIMLGGRADFRSFHIKHYGPGPIWGTFNTIPDGRRSNFFTIHTPLFPTQLGIIMLCRLATGSCAVNKGRSRPTWAPACKLPTQLCCKQWREGFSQFKSNWSLRRVSFWKAIAWLKMRLRFFSTSNQARSLLALCFSKVVL